MHPFPLYPLSFHPLSTALDILHRCFPYFSHSITPFMPISISVCLPSYTVLASHILEPFAQCLPLKTPTFNHNLLVFRVPLSFRAHHNLPFPPFYQPCLIHSITVGPGCSAASRQAATTSLSSFLLCPLLPFST